MLRYTVVVVAVLVGGVTSAADLAMSLGALPPQQRGAPGMNSPEKDRLIFDACVTFYGVVYSMGRLLYRRLGAHAEAEELRRWSRWHMALLHIVAKFFQC